MKEGLDLRFPIGEYVIPEKIDQDLLLSWRKVIQDFPSRLSGICQNLDKEQLQWRYRPEGWMIKQVVHHCSDSHMNALIRFKLALTEEKPTIRPYEESRWAELVDSHDDDLSISLSLLDGIHHKWTQVLSSMSAEDMHKRYVHPEYGQEFSMEEVLGNYAWHCDHHFAHIEQALRYEGNFSG